MEVFVAILIISNGLLIFFVVKSFVAPKRLEVLSKLIHEGKTQVVIKSALAIIARKPQSAEAHYYLGQAYLAENRTELALIELKRVSQLGEFENEIPELEFRQQLAQLFRTCDQPEDAIKEYLVLINKFPGNAEFYYWVGKIFIDLNRNDKAKVYLSKACELNPQDGRSHCELGALLYREKKTMPAKMALEKAIKVQYNNAEAYFYLGKLLKDAKDYTNALSSLEKALASSEYKRPALMERAQCFMALSAEDKAIPELEWALSLSDDEVGQDTLYLRYFLAQCYEKTDQIEKALVQWDAVHGIMKNFQDVEEKLVQYEEFRFDNVKDYLASREQEFLDLCKHIVSKALGMEALQTKVMSNGCEVFATAMRGRLGKYGKNLLIRFYRMEMLREQDVISLLDVLKVQNIARGIIASSSGFSQSAREHAESHSVDLWDKEQLQQMLQKAGPLQPKKRQLP
jgi:tetratricopeptide (TPR) repeat protein